MDAKIHKALDEYLGVLRTYPNVLNVQTGTRFIGGKDTGQECITVYVTKKKPIYMLSARDVLPREVGGVPVDVVELSTEDWKIGPTEPAKKDPRVQRRIADGVAK